MIESFYGNQAEQILHDLLYVGLLAGLFILPKALQRFHLPAAISAVLIGLLWGVALPEFKNDQMVSFLSSIEGFSSFSCRWP